MAKATPEPMRIDELPLSQAGIDTLQAIARSGRAAKSCQLTYFVGPRGSGQTLVAAVLANEMTRSLQRLKLPQLFSKSGKELEKAIDALFEKAQSAGAVLFFDEADALFGKRSQVKDSHDRYANQEVSYLLKAIAGYKGLVILCSNNKAQADSPLAGRHAHLLTFSKEEG